MNSIWNNNKNLFETRFPELYKIFITQFTQIEKNDFLFPLWTVIQTKNNMLSVEEKGLRLHSIYNPQQEALSFINKASLKIETGEIKSFAFFSCGLGYAPIEAALKYPELPIIIIEPDITYLLAAFTLIDFSPVLKHRTCIFALNCPENTVIQLMESICTPSEIAIYKINAQIIHAQIYFDNLNKLVLRNIQAEKLNINTLERFSGLWMRNSCLNISNTLTTQGVTIFNDTVKKPDILPFLILAAGPSLADILPYLPLLKPFTVIICVETALRACLSTGIEPDFIIITDPQYYAWQHISGLSASSSIMITESAVYPAVYRFKCQKKIQCSSQFPLGQYFEKYIGEKGTLGTGGSVSTTAWDFARISGAKKIFIAGLDLGYPKTQTHIKGSTSETGFHRNSNRTRTAETLSVAALYSIKTFTDKDYNGNSIQTDTRMKMFAWWFESKIATFPQCKTYTLSKKGIYIPGIEYCSPETLLNSFSISEGLIEKQHFFEQSQLNNYGKPDKKKAGKKAYQDLINSLQTLEKTTLKAIKLCSEALEKKENNYQKLFSKLNEIDKDIKSSSSKEIIALIFPTKRQLEKLFVNIPEKDNSLFTVLSKSKIIYSQVANAIKNYKKYLCF